MRYLDDSRVTLKYKLPLSEVVEDFYDRVKSLSSGYATFDYEEADYEEAKLVRLQILLNGEPVDALSSIVHSSRAYVRGKAVCTRLKENIPRCVAALLAGEKKVSLAAKETPRTLATGASAFLSSSSPSLFSSSHIRPIHTLTTTDNSTTLLFRLSVRAALWLERPSRLCGRT